MKTKKNTNCDLLIVGGGITGAGILREAVRAGLNVVLLEQHDFAWGASSRSSKMIHGGLRYLKQGKILLTRESVHHRQRLMSELPGFVEKLDFCLPLYDGGPSKTMLSLGLTLYGMFGGGISHKSLGRLETLSLDKRWRSQGLLGSFLFYDAACDDARLVQMLINESVQKGARAMNGVRVLNISRDNFGRVASVEAVDVDTGDEFQFETRCVINATGPWVDRLHPSPISGKRIRPLRGSHLVFAASQFPLDRAATMFHPRDGRPMMLVPWAGATLFGTTDIDHNGKLDNEPEISSDETAYLFEALDYFFPELGLGVQDCLSAMSGVRPVISSGAPKSPSQESREHSVWIKDGLVSITGGKLTTFRKLAWDALEAARLYLPPFGRMKKEEPVLDLPEKYSLWEDENTDPRNMEMLGTTGFRRGELAYRAKFEKVRHLDDLMLRRTRLGLTLPNGATELLEEVQEVCTPALGWSEEKWKREIKRYMDIWQGAYSPVTADGQENER